VATRVWFPKAERVPGRVKGVYRADSFEFCVSRDDVQIRRWRSSLPHANAEPHKPPSYFVLCGLPVFGPLPSGLYRRAVRFFQVDKYMAGKRSQKNGLGVNRKSGCGYHYVSRVLLFFICTLSKCMP
jgi:hypothetical protein